MQKKKKKKQYKNRRSLESESAEINWLLLCVVVGFLAVDEKNASGQETNAP
jgi:hypothetical protein